MRNSAEKVRFAGNPNVMVCERGTMFGYSDLIVDPRNFELVRDADCPVVGDVTHALQQPAGRATGGGGVASGGLRELIQCGPPSPWAWTAFSWRCATTPTAPPWTGPHSGPCGT